MKIISNGIEKNVNILKHFKINEDEYILYKDSVITSIGLLKREEITRIVKPNNEQLSTIKKIIANFISNNPSNYIYKEENCTILDNNFSVDKLEEMDAQHISLTENQMKNLMHTDDENEDNKGNKLIIVLVIIIVILALSCITLLFKDKIFGSSKPSPNTKTEEKSKETNKKDTKIDNKEKVTSYKLKNNPTIEEILDVMNEASINADIDMYVSVFPNFMQEEAKKHITKEELTEQYNELKKQYGEDVKVTYKITNKIKKDEQWMKQTNDYIKTQYKTNIKVTECYDLEGTKTTSGSLMQNTVDDNAFYEVWYCKFSDGKTRIITG